MSLLALDNVHSYYGHIHALKGISLHVDEGEIVTLIGANGAGKSTTLRNISGLIHPRSGKIHMAEQRHHAACRRTRSWPPASGMSPKGAASSRA